jgi:hypothetical protein
LYRAATPGYIWLVDRAAIPPLIFSSSIAGVVVMKSVLVPLAAFVLSASAAAIAADAPPRGGRLPECRADVEKLCQGVEPGRGRVASCLEQNESQVSTACKDAIAKARDRRLPPATPPQG